MDSKSPCNRPLWWKTSHLWGPLCFVQLFTSYLFVNKPLTKSQPPRDHCLHNPITVKCWVDVMYHRFIKILLSCWNLIIVFPSQLLLLMLLLLCVRHSKRERDKEIKKKIHSIAESPSCAGTEDVQRWLWQAAEKWGGVADHHGRHRDTHPQCLWRGQLVTCCQLRLNFCLCRLLVLMQRCSIFNSLKKQQHFLLQNIQNPEC